MLMVIDLSSLETENVLKKRTFLTTAGLFGLNSSESVTLVLNILHGTGCKKIKKRNDSGTFFRAQLFSLWFPIGAEILVNIYSHWGYINNGTSLRYVSVKWVFMRYLLLFIHPPWLTCTPVHVRKRSSGAVHLSRGNCAQTVANSMRDDALPEKTNQASFTLKKCLWVEMWTNKRQLLSISLEMVAHELIFY